LKTQLAKAKSTLATTYNNLTDIAIKNLEPKFRVFDSCVKSVVCYSAQVWGYMFSEYVERILRFFVKKMLWLPRNTPNYMVYGETGRDPIYFFTLELFFVYIQKIKDMKDDRYPRVITKYLFHKKKGWVRWFYDRCNEFNINYDDSIGFENIISL